MDLEKLRAINWAQTWRLVAEKDLVTMYSTSLADQDIFNGLLKDHPQMVCAYSSYNHFFMSNPTPGLRLKPHKYIGIYNL